MCKHSYLCLRVRVSVHMCKQIDPAIAYAGAKQIILEE